MPEKDGSATPDQLRAAEKRKAAAKAAGVANDYVDERSAPPKGRRADKHDET